MFDKNLRQEDDHILIELTGDLDIYSEEEFKKVLDDIDHKKDIIFDLKNLDYLDSTGLGMFMTIYNGQKEAGKSVKIINAKDNIAKLFKITDLTSLFDME